MLFRSTMGYLVDVPKLLFGQAGYHLSHQNKRQVLNDLSQHQNFFQGHSEHFHLGHHREENGEHDHSAFHRLHSKIGGFVMPRSTE